MDEIQRKIFVATKWSTITEITAKIVTPLTNMILARILAPEAFGVVTTVTMIISFADMFANAGFQKYLIQYEFKDDNEKARYANVAFWTNFGISIILWLLILLLRHPIATMVGSPGLGDVLAVASLQLLLTSFSSIQMALYRRNFDFKVLFYVRVISVFLPFVITIPLAIVGLGYWSLIIGTLSMQLSNAVILTVKSKWKPTFNYSFKTLRTMLSFSSWSFIEAITLWLTAWVDIFIIGNALNQYYLGVYKVSTSVVDSLLALITASTIPVLFSALSRLQSDEAKFNEMFLRFQRLVSIFVFPLGVGVFLYRELATQILLGNQWSIASNVIGIWAVISSIQIVFTHFCSEVYRAKGKANLSFLAQVLYLIVLIPVVFISSGFGFWVLIYVRAFIRLESIVVHLFIMKYSVKFSVLKMFKNVLPSLISALVMGMIGYLLQKLYDGILWNIASIGCCIIIYFSIMCLFQASRNELIGITKKLLSRRIKLN